jgi:hypothetical protein
MPAASILNGLSDTAAVPSHIGVERMIHRPGTSLCAMASVAAIVIWGSAARGAGPAADAPADPAAIEAFERQIRPLLAENCHKCHGPDKQEGGLRLDRVSTMRQGGDSGPAVVPGDVEASLLARAIRYTDDFSQMPPSGKLPAEQIELLTDWIARGAAGPTDEPPLETAGDVQPFDLDARQEFWCWQPVTPVAPPAVAAADWPRSPLDNFILARLEAAGLSPAPDADRATWLRRVTFDLIGLPPTPDEVSAFLADDAPGAKERVVDRLLDSPHYGERWARHWLDLARYAETYGHEFDYPIQNAWQYRDYLIRAFNADVPYDQFIAEHLAGDLLSQPRRHPTDGYNESIIGTGFWFLGEDKHAPVDPRGDETNRFDNQIDVLTKSFLGLTVSCARCHDHKFDAITQADYYALAGFLKSSRRQDALLDPHGRIAAGAARLSALRAEGDAALADSLPRPTDAARDDFAQYLLAAREALHGQPRPGDPDPRAGDIVFEDFEDGTFDRWRVEGEAFLAGPSRGTNDNQQEVSGFEGQFLLNSYPGSDGPHGKLTSQPFKIERPFIRFLIGGGAHRDQTCVNLRVDDAVVRTATGRNNERLEGHSWDVTDLLGREAVLEIVDANSGGWGHVNLDQIVFGHQPGGLELRRPVDAVASETGLPAERLRRWVLALADPAAREITHPLYAWSTLAARTDGAELVTARQQLLDELNTAEARFAEGESGTELFEDFRGDFDGWFVTGDTFGDGPTAAGEWDATDRAARASLPGVAHSGRLAGRLRGVLRSPTFTISKPYIDYRMAGRGGQIRLIIDGYIMDVFNGLLYGGVSFPVETDGKMVWYRQAGDASRFVGHRAHIEIIDDGDGWVAVDAIRFSDGPPPQPAPNRINLAIAMDEGIDSVGDLAVAYGTEWRGVLASWHDRSAGSDRLDLANWALAAGLTDQAGRLAETAALMDAEAAALPEPIRVIAMTDGTPEDEWLLIRGNHKTPGDIVPRRFLEAIDGSAGSPTATGSGRLELAARLTDPANPLVSRVIVNRLWHHLFGRGIVASVDNFGVLGERPTHPELLDFLAERFVRDGWSLKRLTRELVLSRTYGMSSVSDERGTAADPQNLLLHCMRVKRLQGEAIRDAVLAVSGRLDGRLYGPPVAAHLTEFMDGRGRPGASGPLDGDGRRSIYLEVRRNFLNPMFLAFDFPIPFNAIGRRTVSNVPAQALTMMNDPLIVGQCRGWAEQLAALDEPPSERIDRIYQSLYARPASSDEREAALAFLAEQGDRYGNDPHDIRPWADLCHVLMNVKEFIFVQ